MKFYSTKQVVIVLSIMIVVMIGLHYLVFSFIRQADVEVNTLGQEVQVLQGQVSEFSKYRPEELRNLAQAVISKFVSQKDFVDFIETIETEARVQGLAVATRSVGVEQRSDDPSDDKEIIRLKLETRGSWANTMRFVNYLEHLPYKISVRSLRLSNSNFAGGESKIIQWENQIEITALKLK